MSHAYDKLTPDTILNAIDDKGFETNGSTLALNSYENRVLQIGIEESEPVIAKFYRPQRWSKEAILEDHEFSLALNEAEIPVVSPLHDKNNKTLFEYEGFLFSLFPRQGGRAPDLDNPDTLEWIGRFLGRIHQLGKSQDFKLRHQTDVKTLAIEPSKWLLENEALPIEFQTPYENITKQLIASIDDSFDTVKPTLQRLHGDVHIGNILWTENGPHFVDMDDCRTGPAVQDLWMLLSGGREDMTWQVSELIEGYRMFSDFDTRELALIEPLRALRLINYTVWLAKRWSDPAFPQAFPWFNTNTYWQDHVQTLEEQLRILELDPLMVY